MVEIGGWVGGWKVAPCAARKPTHALPTPPRPPRSLHRAGHGKNIYPEYHFNAEQEAFVAGQGSLAAVEAAIRSDTGGGSVGVKESSGSFQPIVRACGKTYNFSVVPQKALVADIADVAVVLLRRSLVSAG